MSAGSGEGSGELRVLSWNVHDMLGDPLAVARVIRSARPDVVCLQEAPRWPGSRGRLAALARSCDLLFTCGGRPSAGTALLTSMRLDVTDADAVRLPTYGLLTRPRGSASATVSRPGHASVRVTSLHLGLTPMERADHTLMLLDTIGDHPAVLAGDLNEPPSGPDFRRLAAALSDPAPTAPPTHPASGATRRIDAIFPSSALPVLSYGPWPYSLDDARLASDHLPVLAVLDLPQREDLIRA